MTAMWRCRLFWGNPHTTPPSGEQRVVMSMLCGDRAIIPAEIRAKMSDPDYAPGTGWTIGFERIDQPPVRRWSREAKARERQGNLRKRIERKFPLFAEDFIQAELAARPGYYEARA